MNTASKSARKTRAIDLEQKALSKKRQRYSQISTKREVGAISARRLSGRELLALPRKEAARILKRASALAAKDYEPGGNLRVFEANDPILDD